MGLRLPTIEELTSLADPSAGGPFVPVKNPFVLPPSGTRFWSSTSLASSAGSAYRMNFQVMVADTIGKVASDRVWCVRGGPGFPGPN